MHSPLPPSDEGGGFCRRQKTEGETKIAVIPMFFSPSVASRQLPRQRELGFASAYFAVQAILPSRKAAIYFFSLL